MHRLKNWQLLAICVLTWGTTWYAITFQIGLAPPEVAVALRFGLAGGVVLAMCALRGVPLRFTPRDHARLALQGGFMYGLSYLCVYHAELHVVSGLVAVGYSASPLVSGLGARLLFGIRVTRRFVFGGLLGLAGVALIFWPEFSNAGNRAANAAANGATNAATNAATSGATSSAVSGSVALGALFTVASVLLSSVGSLTASRNRAHGLPFWPALGFGMVYGAALCAAVALVQGQRFAPPAVASWWAALLYLSLAGSVLTFACFLTLQERIGPGPAGTVGVMTPLLALMVSVGFERFQPDALTLIGAALAVLGNVLILRPARPRSRAVSPA